MPNNYTSIGFSIETDEDLKSLVERASRAGDPIAAPSGYYLPYRIEENIELWVQATPIGDFLECVPYYRGESRLKIGVADLMRRRDRPLDGTVYGWVNPSGPRADGGDYPVIVKIPDYEIFRSRVVPQSVITMQITAFTNEIEIFENDEAFAQSQPEHKRMGSESFIPAGLLADGDENLKTPDANAVFAGHVNAIETRKNQESGHNFYHMLISTFGGVYDVVADPALIPTAPETGWVVRGSFRLVGRLVL